MGESEKRNEELGIKLDFDQQMINDKEQEIEGLLEERKKLRQQVEGYERIGKD